MRTHAFSRATGSHIAVAGATHAMGRSARAISRTRSRGFSSSEATTSARVGVRSTEYHGESLSVSRARGSRASTSLRGRGATTTTRASFSSPTESYDESHGTHNASRQAKALVERLASTFLTTRSPRRRSAATRAWLVDEVAGPSERSKIIKATEFEVADARDLRSSGSKGLELYDKLRAHERAIIVAQLLRPTVLGTLGAQGEDLAYVDAEALATDEPGGECDDRLANYCFSCPLRSFGASTDEDVASSMCGFECAIRSRIESRSPGQATYSAAVFSTKSGGLEEFLIISQGDSHVTRRAKFSRELREKLGVSSR